MCTGKCRLFFAQTIHKTSWYFFPTTKKKTSVLSSCFDFLKICCSYAGHTLSISLAPLSFHVLLPSPNHNEPATTRGYRMTWFGWWERRRSRCTMAMMTATTIAIGARATTGGRLAYLCCAWQYSALSSWNSIEVGTSRHSVLVDITIAIHIELGMVTGWDRVTWMPFSLSTCFLLGSPKKHNSQLELFSYNLLNFRNFEFTRLDCACFFKGLLLQHSLKL